MEVSGVLGILGERVGAHVSREQKNTNKKPLTVPPLPVRADTCGTPEQLFACAASNLVFSATPDLKALKWH